MNEDFGLPPADTAPAEAKPAELSPQDEIAALKAQLAAKDVEVLKAQVAALQAQSAPANLFKAAPDEGVDDTIDVQGFPKKYVWITVFRGQNAQDLDYVTPGIGGHVLKIMRGERVVIPEVFAQVLDHCVEDITIKAENGLVTRPTHRFPFSVHGPATEEEYLQFRDKMRVQGTLMGQRATQ